MSGADNQLVADVEGALPGETARARAAHASLKGVRALWPFLGPALASPSSSSSRLLVGTLSFIDLGGFPEIYRPHRFFFRRGPLDDT
jgi:hypothetical protein